VKISFKNVTIVGLVFTFALVSSLCCDPSKVQAEDSVPKCHQTTQDSESSQSHVNDSCCLDIVSLNLEKVNFHFEQTQIAKLISPIFTSTFSPIASNAEAYQAPPHFYNTLPLYIKYSILRI